MWEYAGRAGLLETPTLIRALRYLVPLATVASAAALVACDGDEPDDVASDEQAFSTGPKLAFDEYDVLFTNPTCRLYEYADDEPVVSNAGDVLLHKPKDVFCAPSDSGPSSDRDSSPQKKLLDWIADPATTEIFFAYLSFSNRVVGAALCKAIEERNVKVTFVLDRTTDLGAANSLLACKPGNGDPNLAPRLELRGHDATIGYAHNKIFLVNPRSANPRIVFSSGNMSSGIVLHHENWHFLRVPASTHFAKAHVCLMDGMLDHYRNKKEFGGYIKACRDAAGIGEESDIKTFFVPGDGGRAGKSIESGIRSATSIGIAAHRFSYAMMRKELIARLDGPDAPQVRLIVDDDLWWARDAEHGTFPNTRDEFWTVRDLEGKGMSTRYMETNHGARYLHHNKFVVFQGPQGEGVFTGAGNFTGTAFSDNFENFYFITIPHVVAAMKAQYEHLWALGTAKDDLPSKNVLPPTGG